MNKQNHERITPQMLLIKNSKHKLLDCFQNEYLDLLSINEPSFSFDTPLILACKEGHYELVKFLIQHGADICFQNPLGNTAFHYADETSIKILLDHCQEWDRLPASARSPTKPDPNIKNKESLTPLIYHCREKHDRVVAEMLNYPCVDIKCQDNDGRTCLHYTCSNNALELLKKLVLNCKIDINSKTREGNTPLHTAVYKNNLDMIKFLLEHEADPTIKNNKNKSPKAFTENDDIISLIDGKSYIEKIFINIYSYIYAIKMIVIMITKLK